MQIIHFDEKEGKMKLEPENVEDLWHIQKIINEGDTVAGQSERSYKTKAGKKAEEKKKIFVEIKSEKIEFHKHANILRVTGRITGGSPEEYIQIGSYHTLEIKPRIPIVIKKEKWTEYEKERIKEAQRSSRRPILKIIVLDDKRANIATLRGYGIDFEYEIENKTSKMDENYEEKVKKYFSEILKTIEEFGKEDKEKKERKEMKEKRIIIGGPGFTAESLKEYIKEKNPILLKNILFTHTSTAERSGIYELVKCGIISKVIKEDKISKEFEKIENFLAELRKEEKGLAVYGKVEVMEAIEKGSLRELFIADDFLRENPEILDIAKKRNIEVTIFTTEEEAYKKLKMFGGIAGILRYR